jgi:hypothetical protein
MLPDYRPDIAPALRVVGPPEGKAVFSRFVKQWQTFLR